MNCENCDKFESYEDPPARVPDNCVTFMCNNGECPNNKKILISSVINSQLMNNGWKLINGDMSKILEILTKLDLYDRSIK